ncbi:MAG: DctP family TRAP transporter solute-binding subunit [Oceanospirillaceae bacterium]|nr:DctP family TRAP transporter solute-binding subunit [Oceanospirillaceae bacterium]
MKNILSKLTVVSVLSASLLVTSMQAAAQKTIRFGHDNKADVMENPAHAFAGVFKNIVESATNGEIKVQIYPSNQLGSAKEHVQQVKDGIIQATLTSTGALSSYYPRIGVLDLAFAFNHNAATYDVFDGEFGATLAKDINKSVDGVKVLGFPDTGGFFSITNSVRAINTLEDFKGIRIRTMTLPSHQKIIQALGGEAYPLAWGEVYSSLQTGVIDGQMNPIPTVSFAKFNEVQEYLTLTNHLFAPYTFMLNDKFYESLTEQEQQIIRYATHSGIIASRGIARAIEASEDRGLAGLAKKMKVNSISAKERSRFKAAAEPAILSHVKETLGAEGVELLNLFISEVEKANNNTYLR